MLSCPNQKAEPRIWLEPLLVITFTVAPVLRPNSAFGWPVRISYSEKISGFVNCVAAPPKSGSLLLTLSMMKLLSRPREPFTEKGTNVLAKLKVVTLATPGASSARSSTSGVKIGSEARRVGFRQRRIGMHHHNSFRGGNFQDKIFARDSINVDPHGKVLFCLEAAEFSPHPIEAWRNFGNHIKSPLRISDAFVAKTGAGVRGRDADTR